MSDCMKTSMGNLHFFRKIIYPTVMMGMENQLLFSQESMETRVDRVRDLEYTQVQGQVKMDREEALTILEQVLEQAAAPGFEGLSACIGESRAFEVQAASGQVYQIEMDILWDGRSGEAIRIIASVDDGKLRAFFPLTRSKLVLPVG